MDKKIYQDSFMLGKRMVTVEAWSTVTIRKTDQEETHNKDLNQERR